MYQMKRFIDMEQSPLSVFLLFINFGLCSVSYTVNEYSIYHFCIMITDFHFFFKSDLLSNFETVTFCNFLSVIASIRRQFIGMPVYI